MTKSKAKRARNGFVRLVRAETALNCWTRALGYVMSLDRDQAIRLIQERIDYERGELRACSEKRRATEVEPWPRFGTTASS